MNSSWLSSSKIRSPRRNASSLMGSSLSTFARRFGRSWCDPSASSAPAAAISGIAAAWRMFASSWGSSSAETKTLEVERERPILLEREGEAAPPDQCAVRLAAGRVLVDDVVGVVLVVDHDHPDRTELHVVRAQNEWSW